MSTKIFVGNLDGGADAQKLSEKLRGLFREYGNVTECDVLGNFGFVHMENAHEAEKAIAELHQRSFAGTKINVELSKSKGPRREGGGGSRGRGGGRGGGRGRGGPDRGPSRGYDRPSPYARNGDGGRRMVDDYDRRDRYPSDYRRPYPADPYARDRYSDPYARRSPPPDPYDPYRRAPAPYARDPYYRDRVEPYDREVPREREPRDPYDRPPPEYYRRERQDDMRPLPRSEYPSRDAGRPRESGGYASRDVPPRASGEKAYGGVASAYSRDYPSAPAASARNGFSRGGGSAYSRSSY